MNSNEPQEWVGIAETIGKEILAKPFDIHEKRDLPQPVNAITDYVENKVSNSLIIDHEVLAAVHHSLAGEYNNLPQMLLLQYYKALSNPKLRPSIPDDYFKRVEKICLRIYYSVTYKYEEGQVKTLERILRGDANATQSAAIQPEINIGPLKLALEWKLGVALLQGASFIRRLQDIKTNDKTFTANEMSASEALNIFSSLLEDLNKISLVFQYKPIQDSSTIYHKTFLDKTWEWFRKTLLWKLIEILLIIPNALYKVLVNIILYLPLDRKIFGKKKIRVLFIIDGFDPSNPDAQKVKSQLNAIVKNPNVVILLIE